MALLAQCVTGLAAVLAVALAYFIRGALMAAVELWAQWAVDTVASDGLWALGLACVLGALVPGCLYCGFMCCT